MVYPLIAYAPWTEEQVKFLNDYQVTDRFSDYACMRTHERVQPLVATTEGWVCPIQGCTYTQNWALGADVRGEPE